MANNEDYAVKEDLGEWGIPLEDLGESDIDDEEGDLILEQHLTVYNKAALERLLNDFKLRDLEPLEVVSVTNDKPLEIKDVYDDLSREEAFYNQALAAARHVKQQTEELDVPFLPAPGQGGQTIRDYKNKANAAAPRAMSKKKAAADKEEHEFIDQMKLLKRKRKEAKEDDFTLDVDYDADELEETEPRKKKYQQRNSPNAKLNRKNEGSGRQKPLQSSLKKKGPKKRPGKARRAAIRNRH